MAPLKRYGHEVSALPGTTHGLGGARTTRKLNGRCEEKNVSASVKLKLLKSPVKKSPPVTWKVKPTDRSGTVIGNGLVDGLCCIEERV
jgi:hypothetical protein